MTKLHIRQTVDLYFEVLSEDKQAQQEIIEDLEKRAEEVITNAINMSSYTDDLAAVLDSSAVETEINPDTGIALEALKEQTLTEAKDWESINGPESGAGEDYYFRCKIDGETWWVNVDQGEVNTVERFSFENG